jgi:S1-C subfamily serine protease
VAKDDAEAVRWYQKAAEQGEALAQYNLGVLYANGIGVQKDAAEAVRWYRRAAEQGDAIAQFNLGTMYRKGEGIAKDPEEAAHWYRKAAEQGLASAQYNLGVCFHTGSGVAKDDAEAARWFRKAADQGLIDAQYELGCKYGKGEGVAKDKVERYKWLLLAGAHGDKRVQSWLTIVEESMTPAQRAQGQRLAREWKPVSAALTSSSTGGLEQKTQTEPAPTGSGTGFAISEDGFLVTNEHVVRGGRTVKILTEVGLVPARVVKVNAADDLALLKAEGNYAPLPVAASRSVKLGATVATVGFPNIGLQGFSPKLAKGEIASLSGMEDDARYFQISVPVQPGNSGGALVDDRGNVVGVISAKLSARLALATSGALPVNVNYAVKSSYLLSFLESVPEAIAKLKAPNIREVTFEDAVKAAVLAAVLVLVY